MRTLIFLLIELVYLHKLSVQLKPLGIVSGAASALTAMAPALLTIVVLVVVSRRIGQPSALTRPFDRNA